MTSGDLDPLDMVTQKNLYNPGRVFDICAKNEVNPTTGLGGVRPQTHTDRLRTYHYHSIDVVHVRPNYVILPKIRTF